MRKILILLFVALLFLLGFLLSRGGPSADTRLHDLNSLQELKTAFNSDRGMPRIVLLLSPT